jgi:hypothetical protein
LPAPKDSSQEEINLAKISSLTSIIDSEDDLCLFSMEKIKKIVNSALIDSTRHLFWNNFLISKQQVYMTRILTTPTAVDSWEHVYEKQYSRHRVTFLNSFIKMRLEVLRNMQEGSKKKHEPDARHGSKVTDSKEKFTCPLCQTAHRDDKYSVRAFLSCCQVFLEMSVQLRIDACSKFEHCKVCTSSKKNKRHQSYSSPGCPDAERFKCKFCTNEAALRHCTLLCLRKAAGGGQTSNYGRGGARGRGGGRGTSNAGRGRGRGRSSAAPFRQQPPAQQPDSGGNCRNTNTPDGVRFFDLQSDTDFLDSKEKYLDELMKANLDYKTCRNIVQPIMGVNLLSGNVVTNIMALSDSGSTVGFTIKSLCTRLNIPPAGEWKGEIETIYSTQTVVTNFYKLSFGLKNKSSKTVFCLETESLGSRAALPPDLVDDICKNFKVDKALVYKKAGRLELLLGQDSQSLLLSKTDNKPGANPFFQDISIQSSPASPWLSIVGAVGPGEGVTSRGRNFRNKIIHGNFGFNSNPPPA